MTLWDVMTRVETDRPGETSRDEMRKWLSQLDGKWLVEVIATHAGAQAWTETDIPAYNESNDGDHLLIQPPYDEVYLHYLYSKIDYRLGEIDRYNNAAALFNQEWAEAVKAYNRSHMPRRGQLRHIVTGMPLVGDDPLNLRTEE